MVDGFASAITGVTIDEDEMPGGSMGATGLPETAVS
jgi:hypothetical protein